MKIKVLKEAGYEEAMLGLSLSFNREPADMPAVAKGLAKRGGGHGKFLESIAVWLDVTAPMDFWLQADTYRVGMTKQSESTMHTLTRTKLAQENFEAPIPLSYLNYLNSCIDGGAPIEFLKKMLPCGFLQRRVLCTNYKTLQHIINQRKGHKLPEWKTFIESLRPLEHYDLIGE